jgi:hypothetical protein
MGFYYWEGMNILEILEVSLLDSPTLDLSIIEYKMLHHELATSKYFSATIGYSRKLVLNLRTCFFKLAYSS